MSVNQRKETRHPLNLDACFMNAQLAPQACKIRDFCKGGMYLSFSSRLIQFNRGDEITVGFNLTVNNTVQSCQILVRVAHFIERGMGVMFAQAPSQELLDSLHIESEKASKVGSEQTTQPETVRLMQTCRLICAQHMTSLIADFLIQSKRQLLLETGKTLNTEEKKEYNQAVRFIDKNPNRISETFLRKINKDIEAWVKIAPRSETEKMAPKFHYAEEDFDDWLMIKVMVTKIETEFLEELYGIQIRLNHLFKAKFESHNNPFGPYIICHTFKDVFDPFLFKQKTEKIIYRVFSDAMIKYMKILYSDLNKFLIKEEVLPKLSFGDTALTNFPRR